MRGRRCPPIALNRKAGVFFGVSEVTELPDGIVDLYVHALPDLIERSEDDVEVSRRLQAAGFRAAVHRHHFQSTTAQSRLAREVTGFPLYGAIVCNSSVGGLNPAAVEVALAGGAKWVGLPTLSAAHHQKVVRHVPGAARRGVDFAAAPLELVDADGELLEEVRAIVSLADRSDALVGIGYPSLAECVALLAAGRRSAAPFVLTNPAWAMGLSPAEVDTLLGLGNAVIEITCYSLYRAWSRGDLHAALDQVVELARAAGPDRVFLSSDSGITAAPPAPELIGWAVAAFLEHGASEAWVDRLLVSTPASLLALA
jgi:hypothetical protein